MNKNHVVAPVAYETETETEKIPIQTPPQSIPSGPPKIAIALYDYIASAEGELTVKENENVLVLDKSDPDWWVVRSIKKGGGEGYVPRTYLEMKQAKVHASEPDSQSYPDQPASPVSFYSHSQDSNQVLQPPVQPVVHSILQQPQEEERIQKEEEAKRLATWKILEEQRIKMEMDLKVHDEEMKKKEEAQRIAREQEQAKKQMELDEIKKRLEQDELKRKQEQEQLAEMTKKAALLADQKARDQLQAKLNAPVVAPRPQPQASVPIRSSSLETPSIPARPSLVIF